MNGIISVNGVVTPPEKAVIPALDRGLLYCDSVFEVFVAFGDKVLDLTRHLARLRRSAAELAIEIPWSDDELGFEIDHLCSVVKAPKKHIRLVVTRGAGTGLRIPTAPTPHRIVYVFPANEERAAVFAEGVALKKKKLPYKLEGETPKTTNYTRSILALREADSQGFYDVLWTNLDDEVTEATTANIFFIGRHGSTYEISTPALQCGLLPGITRETILRLMRDAGVDVSEAVIYGNELPRYDEAFLCSTVRGLVPVERVDSQHFHTTRPNSIFHMIEASYLKWVQLQLGFKVNWNTGERA